MQIDGRKTRQLNNSCEQNRREYQPRPATVQRLKHKYATGVGPLQLHLTPARGTNTPACLKERREDKRKRVTRASPLHSSAVRLYMAFDIIISPKSCADVCREIDGGAVWKPWRHPSLVPLSWRSREKKAQNTKNKQEWLDGKIGTM